METRSNYVLVGSVTLALLIGLLVFIVWLAGLVVGGIALYFAALWAMGVRAGQFRLQPPATSL